jgi:hypothetical protein
VIVSGSWRRRSAWFGVPLLAFALLLLAWQAMTLAPLLREDAPYEAWDEVATYNGARVLSGPTANWVYRYGTLDTFIQIVANQYFLLTDPYGAQFPHFSYSNNAYGSLTDPNYVYKMKVGEFGFNYFRGIDDHRPILIARRWRAGLFYGLAAAMMIGATVILGTDAFFLIIPLLCLTVTHNAELEAYRALPNAINAMLSFVVTALFGLALQTGRARLFYPAAALLAVAINFKIDMTALTPILGLALLWHGVPRGSQATLRVCLVAGAVFVVTFVAVNPLLVLAPQVWLKWIVPPVNQARPDLVETVSANLVALARALKDAMSPVALPVPALVLLLVGGGAAVVVGLWRKPALERLIPPCLAAATLWLVPVGLVADYQPRYGMNGLGAFYAAIGIGLLCLWRDGGRYRGLAAAAVAVVLAGQYGMLFGDDAAYAGLIGARTQATLRGDDNAGYDYDYSRTIIEWHVIEAAAGGSYDSTVLVDQHAYLDLGPLRRAGLNAIYINIETLDRVLAGLDRSVAHLVIYAPGSYAADPGWWRPWMTKWPPALEQRYDEYLATLQAWPTLAEAGSAPQRLLWVGPVDRRDHMVAAVIPVGTPSSQQ